MYEIRAAHNSIFNALSLLPVACMVMESGSPCSHVRMDSDLESGFSVLVVKHATATTDHSIYVRLYWKERSVFVQNPERAGSEFLRSNLVNLHEAVKWICEICEIKVSPN